MFRILPMRSAASFIQGGGSNCPVCQSNLHQIQDIASRSNRMHTGIRYCKPIWLSGVPNPKCVQVKGNKVF